ncbi:hypothetical protein [Burkholderia alba]|uniref:hypothetical protein n=1 Tax=Burkholderia alba TaxID=2683677 RepID=UPI002B05CA15|nr:hypothetical protein [Burkholderia alba]
MRYTDQVSALLLDFAMLPERARRDFLSRVNEFLIMSPLQKRRVMQEWEQTMAKGRQRARSDACKSN